jgi:hypothetical protein
MALFPGLSLFLGGMGHQSIWRGAVSNLLQKVNVPEGESGSWKVSKFTVSEEEARKFNMHTLFSLSDRGRRIDPGTYTRLSCSGRTVMSDTPAEMNDHCEFVRVARGEVLIAGLGLGLVSAAVAKKPDVLSVTVVEISEDVINLVSPAVSVHPKVEIILDDIYTWKPHNRMKYLNIQKFDYSWYDIWNDLCVDNLEDMKFLHRRFGRWVKNQGSWGRSCIERRKIQ